MLEESVWPSLLWMLFCVVAIIAAAYLFTRHVAGRGLLPGSGGRGGRMELLDQIPLGREQRVALVRVGERFFLLGITPNAVSALAEFTAEEAALWRREEKEQTDPPSFKEALRITLRNRGRR